MTFWRVLEPPGSLVCEADPMHIYAVFVVWEAESMHIYGVLVVWKASEIVFWHTLTYVRVFFVLWDSIGN